MDFFRKAGKEIKNDHTFQRAQRDGARVFRALPRATAHYLVEKVPVVHWAPKYNPRWFLNDALAGITIGVLLIPQSLAYAKIATIPGQYGLMSSWLPNFLYFIMGTSKGRFYTSRARRNTDNGDRYVHRANLTSGSPDC